MLQINGLLFITILFLLNQELTRLSHVEQVRLF